MTYSQNKSRLLHLANEGKPEPSGGESWGPDCWIYSIADVLTGAGCAFVVRSVSDISLLLYR